MIESASLLAVAPELVLTVGGLALMLVAAWGGEASSRVVNWLAVLTLVLAGVALSTSLANGPVAFDGLVRADAFSAFAKGMIYAAAAAAILLAPRYFQTDGRERPEYPVLILFSAIGMGMMVSAGDLLTLYVGLEMQSLAAYVLASFMRQDARSSEAGLKYFVLGSLASGILLYGSALLYGFTGTTAFDGIAVAMGDGVSNGELFGMVFLLAGLAFKMSAVPFHMWTPDVYEGAPTPVTTFFGSAPKVAAMALAVRVAIEALGPAGLDWQQIVIFVALASIILGAVAAIGQTNIKRLMAYSSINNVGFALIGLAAGTPAGVAATMSYMAIYVVMTIGAFACILQMRDADGRPVESIASLAGLSQSRKGLAAAFAIFMFSMAGIPPLFGFWAKFLVFDAAVAADLTALAAFGIAASVIGAFYYLKIIKTIYFDEPAAAYEAKGGMVENVILTACAVVIVFGYLLNPALDAVSAAAAASLF
ncbi:MULTISPECIES: NADH-quinone oxidoreductase subunit NuoN [Sphingobium]|jgi:NADH-quinone oxidoreductase subunit N|uniref:NADH-quinone oxidoreductase subunit NuoN n=1 Tax=Sphingobium TaxID=165695 RepID=UPI000C59C46B|nr:MULTISPECIES: NADH-quinone oxidoreductase subunit NuoN [Sphingobium]MBS46937.1 NADH-quinone oxidoreductase subunit NuoN [Sphingobium sp.]MCC4258100.1 NADH-quinone oxidoreductase subunit NuoN [Sphingobium lactosutens]MEE2741781.1 NADH-quinone oxidoreductase subunit NuoN [Pseudomonadota bacterium]HCW59523.1 NADH-quinone oxidoreductase subunit NuoN [Sphingobium sp.]|tara:strand:+ start:2647 stop:4083 length:1437 start_codon:yes stop_codon:yes gene_type:complete